MRTLVDQFERSVRLRGVKPHTAGNLLRDLHRFVDWIEDRDPSDVTLSDVQAYLAAFADGRGAKTQGDALRHLRRLFRFAVSTGAAQRDPTAGLSPPRLRTDPRPAYTPDEVRRLLSACDTETRHGVRAHAAVLALFDTGLRAGELVAMEMPDPDTGRFTVRGKTGVRTVRLGWHALAEVQRYAARWGITDAPLWRGRWGPLTYTGLRGIVSTSAPPPASPTRASTRSAVLPPSR